MGFSEVSMPMTEHSVEILTGSWPSQSVMAWSGYGMAYAQAANALFPQLDVQMDIKQAMGGMEGYLIDTLRQLVQNRETALQNRIAAYRHIANKAHLAANELQSAKTHLADIVHSTEDKIKTSRDNAEKAKQAAAAVPGAAAAIESQLQAAIAALVATAKGDAMARDLQGATTVKALSNDIAEWTAPYANNALPEAGPPSLGNLPASPAPAPAGPSSTTKPVDYTTSDNLRAANPSAEQAQHKQANPDQSQQNIQQAAMRTPDKPDPSQAAKQDRPIPRASAPSSPASSGGSSGGGSPASSVGQMMRPASSGGSPASSSSAANPGSAAQSANAKPVAPVSGTGAVAGAAGAGAGRASGLSNLGSGVAESSARLASGMVNTASNVVSGAVDAGSSVAQNVAQAAAQAPASAAASTTPAAAAAGGAGAPMGMMPAGGAGGAGAAAVSPVTSVGSPSVGGGPAGTSVGSAAPVSGAGGVASQGASGASLAPVTVQGPGVRGVGAGGASGDVLFEQAMDAGRDVVSAMVAQTVGAGHIEIHYAVAVVHERGGTVSAWMATGEGASYIPLGVRVPQAVQLSVTDPVVGHELWESSAAAGGVNPLEIVVRQAQAREMAAPGSRVLAIASSLPMNQVIDWAGDVGARPVSVDPKAITAAAAPNAAMVHRCAVAMPWDWRQANAFSDQERLRVAARHVQMAALTGHLSSGACEKVVDLFELRQPVDEALWREVDRARFMSLIEYEMAMRSAGQGGALPARALASARAAEVVLCLRNYATAEGCADLLYASRLAGAPLNPATAVA